MLVIAIVLALIGGLAVSAQSTVNGVYSEKVGTFESAFISFLTGAAFLTILVLFFGEGNILSIFEVPKWQLTSALLGVFFIFVMVLVVTKIGVTGTNITAIIGQLLASMVIDHFGWFGKAEIDFDLKRWIGIIFMIIALYLLFNDPQAAEDSE